MSSVAVACEFFTVTKTPDRKYDLTWYNADNKLTKMKLGHFSRHAAIWAGEDVIRLNRPDRRLKYKVQPIIRDGQWWLRWLDDRERLYYLSGPYLNHEDATEDFQRNKELDTLITPLVRENDTAFIPESESNDNFYTRPRTRQSINNYRMESFDEKWSKGVKQFLKDETLDVTAQVV